MTSPQTTNVDQGIPNTSWGLIKIRPDSCATGI